MINEMFAELLASILFNGILVVYKLHHHARRIQYHGKKIKSCDLFRRAFPAQDKSEELADSRFQWRW